MKYPTIKKLSLTIFATLVAGAAMAQGPMKAPAWTGDTIASQIPYRDAARTAPFFTNLVNNTCTSCMYDTQNGELVLGPTNCFASGSTQWIAGEFQAGHTGVVTKLTLGVSLDSALCTSASSQFTVAIYSDACAGPDTALATARAKAAAMPCGLTTVAITNGPTLTQGTNYWVVAETAGTTQSAFTGVWWEANDSVIYYNLNDGNGWLENAPTAQPVAFEVQ